MTVAALAKLSKIAKVIRSKNAGPFLLTVDIIFEDQETFARVKQSNAITAELFSKLYKTPLTDVIFTEYTKAFAFKGTVPRRISSGDLGDSDVYGAQQHAILYDVEIPDLSEQ